MENWTTKKNDKGNEYPLVEKCECDSIANNTLQVG